MVIRALDLVRHCYNHADGEIIYHAIEERLRAGEDVVLSFDGVSTLPSSFVNAALIPLLAQFSFDQIKRRLKFANTNSQMNAMIRSRFNFEADQYPPNHSRPTSRLAHA